MPQGQAGNLKACFISDWHQIPKRFLKRSGRCAASSVGVIAPSGGHVYVALGRLVQAGERKAYR